MMSSAGSSPQIAKAKMALNKNPADAMAIAEEVLNGDPNNPFAHRIIVDAAQRAGNAADGGALARNDGAAFAQGQEARRSSSPTPLAATGGISPAEQNAAKNFWTSSSAPRPTTRDLKQALKNLSAHKTLDEGGYGALEDGNGSYRDVLREQNGGRPRSNRKSACRNPRT